MAKAINRHEEKTGKQAQNWIAFDEWAINLAKQKGFDRLTEDDVARMVSHCRGER